MTSRTVVADRLRSAVALAGCLSAGLGLALVWLARSRVDRPVYDRHRHDSPRAGGTAAGDDPRASPRVHVMFR